MNLNEKIETNTWDHIDDVLSVLDRALLPHENPDRWSWSRNTECKYLDVRIDMRDGGCIIRDRHDKRIDPKQLAWQYSEETPNMPKCEG